MTIQQWFKKTYGDSGLRFRRYSPCHARSSRPSDVTFNGNSRRKHLKHSFISPYSGKSARLGAQDILLWGLSLSL